MPIETLNSSPPPPFQPAEHGPVGASVTTLHRDAPSGGSSWSGYLSFAGAVFLFSALVVVGRYLYVTQQNKNFTATITNLQQEYAGLKETETKANDIQALSTALADVYKSQLNYTSLLRKLEETTYNGARYSSASLDDKGQVVLNGQVGNYLDFAKTVKAFKEKGTSDAITKAVTINSLTQESTDQPDGSKQHATTFSISFTLDSALLLPTHQAPPEPAAATPAAATPAETAPSETAPAAETTPSTTTPQSTELPEGTL